MIKLLLIGNGRWAQNYISTLNTNIFQNVKNVKLDISTYDYKEKINSNKYDGVIVCTPPQSHIEIASYSLSKNLPTMIEKPLSLSLKEAKTLKQYTAPILVNNIYLFSKQYQYIKNNITNINKIFTIGYGNKQSKHCDELLDYGSHDISMILDISQQFPHKIYCKKVYDKRFFSILSFDTFEAESYFGYHGFRDRFLRVLCNNCNLQYDDMNSIDKPLTNALNVFIDAINGKSDDRLGLELSLQVLDVLEKCQQSLEQNKIIIV